MLGTVEAGTDVSTTGVTVGEYLAGWIENMRTPPEDRLRPLGHATIAVTVDIYSHVTPSMDADAADLVAASIFGALPQ